MTVAVKKPMTFMRKIESSQFAPGAKEFRLGKQNGHTRRPFVILIIGSSAQVIATLAPG